MAHKSGDISLLQTKQSRPRRREPALQGPAPPLPRPLPATHRETGQRDFPECLGLTLNRGSPAAPGRDGGRGPSSDLAAWKATPQVGSDGAELARGGRLYGLPLLLESGDGRRVVTAEVNPARTSCSGASGRPRAAPGRPRAAFESLERRKPRRQGGWVPTTLTRGDGSAARTGTPSRSRYSCVFLLVPSGLEGAAGRRGGGWGAAPPAGPAANLARGRSPGGLGVRVRKPLSAPSPPRPRPGLLRAPGPVLCARVLFSPFFPAHGNAAACVSFRALLVVGLGGGVFLPGPSLWGSEEITASCDKVKRAESASSCVAVKPPSSPLWGTYVGLGPV